MEQSKSIPEETKIWFIKQSHAPLTHRTYKEWARRGQELCYEVAYADGYQEASEAMYHRMAEEIEALKAALIDIRDNSDGKLCREDRSRMHSIAAKALEQYSSPKIAESGDKENKTV